MIRQTALAGILAVGCIVCTVAIWPYPGWPSQFVVVSAFILGLAFPARAWRWALVFGGAILVAQIIRFGAFSGHFPGRATEVIIRANPYHPSLWAGLIAMVPAFAGAQLGSWCRTVVLPFFKQTE